MDQFTDALALLDKIPQPAFCVKNGIIIRTNPAADAHMIELETEISSLLETGAEEYAQFQDGCLYLNLNVHGESLGASVIRIGECHIFCIEQDADNRELRAMALASQELRKPLTDVMITVQKLFPLSGDSEDGAVSDQFAKLNRGLFQMLRVINNMSDADRYTNANSDHQQVQDICSVLKEAFDKAAAQVEHTGRTLEYTGYPECVDSLLNQEKLEKAVHSIISNALDSCSPGGTIRAKLTRRGNRMYLTVQDDGPGIPENLRSSIFSRYTRGPGLDGDRHGIGLGMVLIRSTAVLHGGTVLVDHPGGSGTRVTMSLAIRPGSGNQLRSSRQKIDYTGGWDSCTIELSNHLPAECFQSNKER